VEDLRSLLVTGSLVERKSFLRSWVRRVEFSKTAGGEIEYALPLVAVGETDETVTTREVLSLGRIGSAGVSKTRTFWDITLVIGIPFSRWGARPFVTSPIPYGTLPLPQKRDDLVPSNSQYQQEHPLRLALKWRGDLASNTSLTRAILARREGISRARVTQVLSLLQLPQDAQDFVTKLTNAKAIRFFSERRLRKLLLIQSLSLQQQVWNETVKQFNVYSRYEPN